ncbi:MAG: hypothetical protein KH268_06270 [Clostridiales bacterium]|nr:hypothetical protein [Clostridiales bacterium]
MKKYTFCKLTIGTFLFCMILFIFSMPAQVNAAKLSKKKITMFVGQEKKISVKKSNSNVIRWKSGNKSIAVVKKRGKKSAVIKAKNVGKTIITAKIGKQKIKCRVIVKSKKIEKKIKKAELSQYLKTDIYSFVNKIGNMNRVSTSDGTNEFTNGFLIVSSPEGSNLISFISINGPCNYSIKGLHYGMSMEKASKYCYKKCRLIETDLPSYKFFYMKDGTKISFYAENGRNLDSINIFAE